MNNTIRTLLTAATVVVGTLTGYAVEPAAPGCVTSVNFSHDYNGDAVIGISFNAPAETYEGNTLTQITDLKIYRDDTVIKTYTQPTPGEALTFSDTTPEKKEYTYRFVASNAAGEGEEVEEYVYVGADYAAPAINVSLRESVENPGTAIISWDAPPTYQEGSPINPSLVSYEILAADGVTSLKAGIVGTTTEIEVCGADERMLANFFIISVTERGANYSKYAMTPLLALGQAYETDYIESFNGAAPATLCGGLNDFLRGSWSYVASLDSPAVTPFDNDGGFAAYKPRKKGNESAWYSGKITVPANASNADWSFRYFGVANSQTTLQPFVYADGVITYDTAFSLGDNGEGWQQYSKSIDEYAGKNIQVGVKIVAGDKKHVAIDHVFVSGGESPKISLSDFSIPDRTPVNDRITGSIAIVNNSDENRGYQVMIKKNGNDFIAMPGSTLNAGESVTTDFDDIAPEHAGTVEYTVSVLTTNTDGEFEEIAQSTAEVTITDKGYPTPQGGILRNNGVIEWEEPDYRNFFTSNQVTDDVESYEPFAIDKAGDWVFIDSDGVDETYSFTDFSFPNMGKPMSYIVFDADGMNDTFAAASGTKYFASFSSPYGANDNWMISPDLPGTETTLTFKARSYSAQDPESFEIHYSTATCDIDNFNLLATENNVPTSWTDYTYTLPAGTNFFAIRSTSDDKFFILIDDIQYTRGIGNLELIRYDVYRNFELLGSVDASETSYTLSEPLTDDYTCYQIKAVYNRGESELSLPCTNEPNAIESVSTDTAEETARYNAAGLRVDKNAKGIVFIKYSNGAVRKVIIR